METAGQIGQVETAGQIGQVETAMSIMPFWYFYVLSQGTTEKTAISVKQYSEDRELNSAIMASLNSSKGADFIDLSDDYFFLDDDIRLLSFEPVATYFGKQHSKPKFEESVTEIGSSSSTQNDPDVFLWNFCWTHE